MRDPRASVVLVHGAWHGAWCWQDGFAQRLATRGITTIAPSLRGHGGSTDGVRLNRMRIRDYVDDVSEVVTRTVAGSGAAPFVPEQPAPNCDGLKALTAATRSYAVGLCPSLDPAAS